MFGNWHGFEGSGFGWAGSGHGFGPGFGGHGFGFGARRKRAALATAALLLEGPADAAQIVQRVSEATEAAFTPPQEVAEAAIELLENRGLVAVESGVATLTELGESVLAWRGVTSETARSFLGRAGQFKDVIKIRRELFELGGLARTITHSGTGEQKEKLAEAKAKVLAAIGESKKSLYAALAQG
jgi:DNA-binding PadR family transcriptional regulator